MYRDVRQRIVNIFGVAIIVTLAVAPGNLSIRYAHPPQTTHHSHHNAAPVSQCLTVCGATLLLSAQQPVTPQIEGQRGPALPTATLIFVALAAYALPFVVKYLYRLSSWRPPDKVLLCGHYADGL